MTAREIDMLKDFLSREIEALTLALREMREEASTDHQNVRTEMKTLADRLAIVEDTEAIEQSRKEFRKGLIKVVVAANATAAVLTSTVFLILDHV
jgi:cytochrome P450